MKTRKSKSLQNNADKVAKLPPAYWPIVTPVEIGHGEVHELSDLFEHADKAINQFLRRALEEKYLPAGVRLILLPIVKPEKLKLDLNIRAFTCGPRDTMWEGIVWEMARAADWNARNRASYFQRVLEEYEGFRGSVVVFHAGEPDRKICIPEIHLLQFAYKSVKKNGGFVASHNSPKIPDEIVGGDAQFPTVSLSALTASFNDEQQQIFEHARPEVKFVPAFASDTEKGKKAIKGIGEEILADAEYLTRVASLVSLGTVILAAPRQFYLAASLHKLLGTSGLNLVVEPQVPITSDLLLRCYLLADRLCSLFTTTASYAHSREDNAASETFQMVAHSLGNALTYLPPGNERIESIIRVEEANLRAARWFYASKEPSKSQLVSWEVPDKKNKPFEEILKTAVFTLPDEKGFILDAKILHGKNVDPRLFALIIELTRNLQKHSKAKKGSLVVRQSQDKKCCEIEIISDCDYTCPRDLQRTIARLHKNEQGERGLDFVWALLKKLSADSASCIYTIGKTPQKTTALFNSSPMVRLNIGADVTHQLKLSKDEQDTDVTFSFNCLITGLHLEPTLNTR
jgi:hypothetical protein